MDKFLILSLMLAPFVCAYQQGIVFGAGEWSYPQAAFNTTSAQKSLEALAHTGATHIKLLYTRFQDNINSTTIYPITDPASPLRTPTFDELSSIVSYARQLGLKVFLAPMLDPNWDIASNKRSYYSPGWASRGIIGLGFNDTDWATWFSSYTSWMVEMAQFATQNGVEQVEVASEFDYAYGHHPEMWRAVVTAVRKYFSGPITIAINPGDNITAWADAVDGIGVDAYISLGGPGDDSVASLVAAWQPFLPYLEQLHASTGKPIFMSELGYQSRPDCHLGAGSMPKSVDCSPYDVCYDMTCQANAYEAFFRVFVGQPWWDGIYWWMWHTDDTSGGTVNSDFTPHGKPAEVVLRRWFGNYTCSDDGGYGRAYLSQEAAASQSGRFVKLAKDGSDAGCDGSAAIVQALERRTEEVPRFAKPSNARSNSTKSWNGFVFGSSWWTYSGYRLDSLGARQSIDALVASGAESVEFLAEWYYWSINQTWLYPISDPDSPQRSDTDDEIASIIAYAKSKGLRVGLSTMLDPDQQGPDCKPDLMGCTWRGQIGTYWGTDCSNGSLWDQWHQNYLPYVLHYAKFAEKTKVDAYFISHELLQCIRNCPAHWANLLAEVREVYSGAVAGAFETTIAFPGQLAFSPWAADLDFIGLDFYEFLPGINSSTVPPLPWQDIPETELIQAFQPYATTFGTFASAIGKKIVFTETGFQSRPWSYTAPTGTKQLVGEDCSVWDQCYSMQSQALAYDALFSTFYSYDWFDGTLFWLWRSDPTAGGPSDDDFTPRGKTAASVLAKYWNH